jgi:hypothetical protein
MAFQYLDPEFSDIGDVTGGKIPTCVFSIDKSKTGIGNIPQRRSHSQVCPVESREEFCL